MAEDILHDRLDSTKVDRRTFVKYLGILGGAASLGLPLLGCQPAAAPKPAAAPTQAAAPKQAFKTKVADSSGMVAMAPLYVALLGGFFGKEGIDTEYTEFAGGGEQVRAVMEGNFPLGNVGIAAPIAAFQAGQPVRLVASTGFGSGGTGVVVRADSPFKKPEDLKGKKFSIGHSRPNSSTHMLNLLSLRALGIDPATNKDVTVIATGGMQETWTAVKTGVVDMGWTTEPIPTQIAQSGEGRMLWWYGDVVPDWMDSGIITSQAFIDSNPRELEAWLSAYVKAVEWTKANRAEAAKLVAKHLKIDEGLAAASMKSYPDTTWSGALPQKSLDFTVKAMKEFGVLKGDVKWDEFVVRKFLPANLRSS